METSADLGARETGAPEIPPLDMDAVTREALGDVPRLRAWSLDYLSGGITFKWSGRAYTQNAADFLAREKLGDLYESFSKTGAQLVAAVEIAP